VIRPSPNRRNLIDDGGTLFGFILAIAEQFGCLCDLDLEC
jgi:hypothetical protein